MVAVPSLLSLMWPVVSCCCHYRTVTMMAALSNEDLQQRPAAWYNCIADCEARLHELRFCHTLTNLLRDRSVTTTRTALLGAQSANS